MINIIDGICSGGSILDGLDYWLRSATRKEWFRITRELVTSTIADMDLDPVALAEVEEALLSWPAVTSALIPSHGINVVLNQRQLSSGVPLVLSVLEIWICRQRDQRDGSKKQSQHQPLLGVVALQFGDFFCPDRAGKSHGNDPDPIKNLHRQSVTAP